MTLGEAFAYLFLWRRAACTQSERLLDAGLTDPKALAAQQVDAVMFVLGLRQSLRAADLVRRCALPATWSAIDEAIDRFNAAAPGVVKVRDALDHFDEYAMGTGRLQKKTAPPWPLNWFVAREVTTVKLVLSTRRPNRS